jgi:hypothetical protein
MTETPPTPPEEPYAAPPAGDPTGYPTDPTSPYGGYPTEPVSPYGPGDTVEAGPPPRGRRGLVIGATAAVLAVVAGAAVYAATALSGGGRQPDELVPRTTFAYAKIDLDPAAGQKLAAHSFFGKFPNLKGKTGTTPDDVFENVLDQLVTDDVTYTTDIKPWFDKRAAVAAFPGSGTMPTVVSVLRSKDDAKARASLDKLSARASSSGSPFAYDIAKGYVVISDTKAHVADALNESAKESLRDNDVYRKDVDALSGDQVAVGWVDVAQAFRAALRGIPRAGLLPTALTDRVKGHAVIGVHFADDYVEVEGKLFGSDPRLVPAGAKPALLDRLPAGTVAAFSVNGLGKSIDDAIALTGIDPDEANPDVKAATGLSISKDVLPLIGDQTAIALGSADLSLADLRVGLLGTVKDEAKARAAAAKIAAAVQQLGVPVKATVKDGTFYLATPGDYADQLTGGSGGLTSSPKFQKAVGDLGTPSAVLYLDVQAIGGAEPGTPESALRAFGLVSGYDGDVGYFRARFVVG